MNESTERKLRVAYGKLVRKNSEKITVTDLCKKADVSRATFYIYYKDIDEYAEKLRMYIASRLFNQASELLLCSDYDFPRLIKRDKLIFDEYETEILKNMLSGANYLTFATVTDTFLVRDKEASPFSDSAWERHRDEIDLFTRGYLIMLISGLINYDETSFRSDMRNCRAYFRNLCSRYEKEEL